MKAIQFLFNPTLKKSQAIFISKCFVPRNKSESVLGRLYLAGELINPLPQNMGLMKTLTGIIKQGYYEPPYLEPDNCLKRALQQANDFLYEETRTENTSWQGNLSFIILIITPDLFVRVASVGKLKIIIARDKQMFSVSGEEVNLAISSERTFPNIVEGESITGDKILVINKGLYDNFREQDIFQEINAMRKKRELSKNFKKKKELLRNFFGLCLIIFVKKQRQKIYLRLPSWKFKKTILSILLLVAILVLGYFLF